MAVFTSVSDRQCHHFLSLHELPPFYRKAETRGGTQNTNYIVYCGTRTDEERYILTLFEQERRQDDFDFFIMAMRELCHAGLPLPMPIMPKNGKIPARLCDRHALLTTFLPGQPATRINRHHCRAMGAISARMHQVTPAIRLRRDNDFPPAQSAALFTQLVAQSAIDHDMQELIRPALDRIETGWPKNLAHGYIHADLFPDNVFFDNGHISGIIDPYYSCTDFFAYDLAVTMNAWCFDSDQSLNPERQHALLDAYTDKRPLTIAEKQALPLLGVGAALRFLLTRLRDRHNPPQGRHFSDKDPLEYARILAHHLAHMDDATEN